MTIPLIGFAPSAGAPVPSFGQQDGDGSADAFARTLTDFTNGKGEDSSATFGSAELTTSPSKAVVASGVNLPASGKSAASVAPTVPSTPEGAAAQLAPALPSAAASIQTAPPASTVAPVAPAVKSNTTAPVGVAPQPPTLPQGADAVSVTVTSSVIASVPQTPVAVTPTAEAVESESDDATHDSTKTQGPDAAAVEAAPALTVNTAALPTPPVATAHPRTAPEVAADEDARPADDEEVVRSHARGDAPVAASPAPAAAQQAAPAAVIPGATAPTLTANASTPAPVDAQAVPASVDATASVVSEQGASAAVQQPTARHRTPGAAGRPDTRATVGKPERQNAASKLPLAPQPVPAQLAESVQRFAVATDGDASALSADVPVEVSPSTATLPGNAPAVATATAEARIVSVEQPTANTAFAAPAAVQAGSTPAAPVASQPAVTTSAHVLPEQLGTPLLRVARAGNGEHIVTVKVTPENLGPVTVRAHVDGQNVKIELSTPNSIGSEAVKLVIADLRRDLAAAGVNATLTVGDHGQSDTGSRGNQQSAFQQESRRENQPGYQQPANGGRGNTRQSQDDGQNRRNHQPLSALDVYA